MDHNALVVASAALPTGRDERRHLGLPAVRRPADGSAGAFYAVRLEGLAPGGAAALTRLMGRCGGAGAVAGGDGAGRVVALSGSGASFEALLRRAETTAPARQAARDLGAALRRYREPPSSLSLRRGGLDLSRGPVVMGILNVTPDSFSDGGSFLAVRAAVDHAVRMAEEGAAILDVGGESTRPGSRPVPLVEELRRVLPVLEALVPRLARLGARRPLLSIDTTKAEVARRAAAAGVDLINDISGLTFDPAMAAVAAESGLAVVVSHIRGVPRLMQRAPRYRHLIPEIARFLRRQIERAVRAGVREDRLAVDPGIGFGKRRRDNLAVLRHLGVLRSLGRPILVGASRKSFIGGTLDLPVGERREGSLAAEALAIAGGADIIRAHDVRDAVRVAVLGSAIARGVPASR
jgi:dihydropteroate synthase